MSRRWNSERSVGGHGRSVPGGWDSVSGSASARDVRRRGPAGSSIRSHRCRTVRPVTAEAATSRAATKVTASRRTVRNPAQQAVVDDLFALSQPRPTFPDGLDLALRDLLEEALDADAQRLDPHDLHVHKTAIGRVLGCEAHYVAEGRQPFRWTVANTRGTLAHRAIELAVFSPPGTAPLALIDDVIDRMITDGDDRSPRDFLRSATTVEIGELRGGASQIVTAFEAQFPALEKTWRPRVEASCRVELCGGRIVLRSKVDLALGQAVGNEGRVLIVDIKTGRPYSGHLDDLRFYALLETIRSRIPPFRIASYYLDSGRWQAEDVDQELLELAARRTIDAVHRLTDLHTRDRRPVETPGPACSFCCARETCPSVLVVDDPGIDGSRLG